ncbi:sigma-70 family RNA polymerase sigma factor [Sphingomonas naphthae]|uniref:Sigma-70 family RNA polymerase sigma factor n=1 Tax=Sphingomonas naphthae TaxID=1813468 RepID=A0ABY7TLF6_9SPHN|nr:sigma-70 family RNA polymerase sigma factor [Sphingomonas naphthae]WCT73806.1 sigma-70 family RNA polymerase sigma factor [Sphingomonas naphthae]
MDNVRAKLDWFKAIILPHQPALRARLRRLCPTTGDLEDLVSEVLTRAYANPNWHGVDHGRAYLFTVARNLVIDMTRRDKIVSFDTVVELDLLQSDHDMDAQLCARDELRRMQAIVDTLPGQCRRAFIARRVQEKSMGEIADEMGLSVSTVEKHLGKAVRLIMQALADQEDQGFVGGRKADEGRDGAAGRPAPGRARQ